MIEFLTEIEVENVGGGGDCKCYSGYDKVIFSMSTGDHHDCGSKCCHGSQTVWIDGKSYQAREVSKYYSFNGQRWSCGR